MKTKQFAYTEDTFCTCQRCGRLLKANQSVIRGYGASCYKKFLYEEWERNQMTIFDFIEDPGEVKIHDDKGTYESH